MCSYQYNRLQEEINKKQNFQRHIEEMGYHPEEHRKPSNEQLRRIQLAYNQALALMATEKKWTSQQIHSAKTDFQVFWVEE